MEATVLPMAPPRVSSPAKVVRGKVQPPTLPSADRPGRVTNQLLYIKRKVMPAVWAHKFTWPFKKPVDAVKLNLPDYHTIIKNPMDFGTIRKRLMTKYYWSASECHDDIKLVFSNCFIYNKPELDISIMGRTLEKHCEALMERMPQPEVDQESSKTSGKRKGRPAGDSRSHRKRSHCEGEKNVKKARTSVTCGLEAETKPSGRVTAGGEGGDTSTKSGRPTVESHSEDEETGSEGDLEAKEPGRAPGARPSNHRPVPVPRTFQDERPGGLLTERKTIKNYCKYCDQAFLSKYVRDMHEKVKHGSGYVSAEKPKKMPVIKKPRKETKSLQIVAVKAEPSSISPSLSVTESSTTTKETSTTSQFTDQDLLNFVDKKHQAMNKQAKKNQIVPPINNIKKEAAVVSSSSSSNNMKIPEDMLFPVGDELLLHSSPVSPPVSNFSQSMTNGPLSNGSPAISQGSLVSQGSKISSQAPQVLQVTQSSQSQVHTRVSPPQVPQTDPVIPRIPRVPQSLQISQVPLTGQVSPHQQSIKPPASGLCISNQTRLQHTVKAESPSHRVVPSGSTPRISPPPLPVSSVSQPSPASTTSPSSSSLTSTSTSKYDLQTELGFIEPTFTKSALGTVTVSGSQTHYLSPVSVHHNSVPTPEAMMMARNVMRTVVGPSQPQSFPHRSISSSAFTYSPEVQQTSSIPRTSIEVLPQQRPAVIRENSFHQVGQQTGAAAVKQQPSQQQQCSSSSPDSVPHSPRPVSLESRSVIFPSKPLPKEALKEVQVMQPTPAPAPAPASFAINKPIDVLAQTLQLSEIDGFDFTEEKEHMPGLVSTQELTLGDLKHLRTETVTIPNSQTRPSAAAAGVHMKQSPSIGNGAAGQDKLEDLLDFSNITYQDVRQLIGPGDNMIVYPDSDTTFPDTLTAGGQPTLMLQTQSLPRVSSSSSSLLRLQSPSVTVSQSLASFPGAGDLVQYQDMVSLEPNTVYTVQQEKTKDKWWIG